jgi:hypothetical protein
LLEYPFRAFLLNAIQVLTYYLDRQDPTPRGTLFVENCTIEVPPDDSAKKAKVAGVKALPGQVGDFVVIVQKLP